MTSFHSYLLSLALLVSVSEIGAAQSAVSEGYPIVGTWKFNKEASERLGQTRDFLSRTETYELTPDSRIKMTVSTIAADGSSSEESMAWSARGGITPADSDGRTMHQTWRGFSEQGQPFEVHALFDRQ